MISKSFPLILSFAYARPESVVSKAKDLPATTLALISLSISQAALIATVYGAKGAKPDAIKSALMKIGQLASLGRNSRANVVFPAPLGPAIMIIFLLACITFAKHPAMSRYG